MRSVALLAVFCVPWLVEASPDLCLIFTWPSPCVHVCLQISHFISRADILDLGPPDWLNLYKLCLQWPYFQIKFHSEILRVRNSAYELVELGDRIQHLTVGLSKITQLRKSGQLGCLQHLSSWPYHWWWSECPIEGWSKGFSVFRAEDMAFKSSCAAWEALWLPKASPHPGGDSEAA